MVSLRPSILVKRLTKHLPGNEECSEHCVDPKKLKTLFQSWSLKSGEWVRGGKWHICAWKLMEKMNGITRDKTRVGKEDGWCWITQPSTVLRSCSCREQSWRGQNRSRWSDLVPARGCLLDHLCTRVCPLSPVWLFSTLWTIARQAPPSMGFSRQEYWSGLPCPSPGDLPDPGMEPTSLMSPAWAGRFFTTHST